MQTIRTLGFVAIAAALALATPTEAATPDDAQVVVNGMADSERQTLAAWAVGQRVSYRAACAFGLGKCFVAVPIDNHMMARMRGKSYKASCTVARSDLRYLRLLHYTADGHIQLGELVCHKDISADLVEIFRALFDARYPIESMALVDDYGADDIHSMEHNNTTCFNYRVVAGSRKLSAHSLGKAVDLNPLYNPYVKRRADGSVKVSPDGGRPYADRTKAFKYKIDRTDLAYKLFKKHGFAWGGDWRSLKDYQHFEKE